MKNFCKASLALGLVAVSLNAFADTSAPVDGYYTKTPPAGLTKSNNVGAKDAGILPHKPTDITLINSTSHPIIFEVLQMNTEQVLLQDSFDTGRDNKHIHHPGGSFYTKVVLKNPMGVQITKDVFCPFAIITIRGNPGSYSVNTDSDLCQPRTAP